MRTCKRIAARLFLTALLLFLHLPPAATAQEPAGGVQNTFLSATDQTLTPQTSRYDYFLQVPKQWRVGDAEFAVYFRHSATLLEHASSLSLLVDGTPYATTWLNRTTQDAGTLRAVVPAAQLTPGFHQFSVSAYLRSHQQACDDFTDPANWLVVEKTSFIHVTYADSSNAAQLPLFPFPFVNETGPDPWKADIVVPDDATDGELQSAYRIVSTLARAQSVQASTVGVLKLSEWNMSTHPRHVILVGTLNRLRLQARWQDAVGSAPQGAGLLREVTLPGRLPGSNEPRTALLVTGTDEKAVSLAVQALNEPKLVQQWTGTAVDVTESMIRAAADLAANDPDERALAAKGSVTLKQLGYNETTLSGMQTSSVSYVFATPPMWKYVKGAGVRFHVRYSSLLDEKKSALVATVNGAPIASKQMARATAGGMDFFVPFPDDLAVGAEVRVVLNAEMHLETTDCADSPQGLRRYVTIDPASRFELPHVDVQSAALASFPGAFLSDAAALQATTAVLPAKPTSAELTALARVVAGAASFTEQNLLAVRHAGSEEVAGNVWLFDTAGDNALAKRMAANGELAVRSAEQGLQSSSVPLGPATQTQGGVVQQLFRKQGGVALMIAAKTPEMLLDAAGMLAAKTDIPSDATEAGALRTTTHQTILVPIATKPYLPLAKRIANRLTETYGYLSSPEGRVMLYLLSFAVTLLVVLWYVFLTWRRGTGRKRGWWKKRNRK